MSTYTNCLMALNLLLHQVGLDLSTAHFARLILKILERIKLNLLIVFFWKTKRSYILLELVVSDLANGQ